MQLGFTRQALDFSFTLRSARSISKRFYVNQLSGQTGTRVFRRVAHVVGGEPPFDVVTYAGVKSAIRAAEDVTEPAQAARLVRHANAPTIAKLRATIGALPSCT